VGWSEEGVGGWGRGGCLAVSGWCWGLRGWGGGQTEKLTVQKMLRVHNHKVDLLTWTTQQRPTPNTQRPPLNTKGLGKGQETVYYGFSAKLAAAHGEEWHRTFAMINALGK